MSTSGGGNGPSEPEILAHTKRTLFPEAGEDVYAVTDTQFATQQWRPGASIDDQIREELAPFNHVKLGSGYPDLVGVRGLDDSLVINPTGPSDPTPLIAVEAKGYARGGVDVQRGIAQAHDRLSEANVAFVTVPAAAISRSHRALARDLNVGLLAVESSGDVVIQELPRIQGTQTPAAASAIRFQATAQGVAEQSFTLNHPKNYLAYPLAIQHSAPTRELVQDHVVGAVDAARQGAEFLGLARTTADTPELTPLGQEVVRYALELEGSLDAALSRFEDWKRSRDRFVQHAGEWGALARWVVHRYPATELLIDELQRIHNRGTPEPTLREVVRAVHDEHPAFAVELFIRGSARERVFTEDNELDPDALTAGSVYASPTVFQLKAMLWHAGFLTTRGAEPHRLDPTEDVWQLRHPL